MIKQMKARRGGHHAERGAVVYNCEHENLKKRLIEILDFRKNYEKLREVISRVFTQEHGEHSEVEK